MGDETQETGGKKCLGVQPVCPAGTTLVCNSETGEWACQGIAIDELDNVEAVKETDGTDREPGA